MDSRQMARKLGARGGRARALRLTADRRRRIASQGGAARRESLATARRIADNFAYVEAVVTLQGGRPQVRRMSDVAGPLPGLYPVRSRS